MNSEDEGAAGAVAERLRRARERSGLTQAAVADDLALSRSSVVALEKGTRSPRPQELVRLSQLYATTLEQLLRPSPPSGQLVPQLRRSFERRSEAPEIEKAVYELQQLAEDYVELERLAGAPLPTRFSNVPATAVRDDERAAGALADEERHRLRLGDGPLPHLRELLETDVGLRVFATKLPSAVAGLFAYDADLGAVIAINAGHPFERQRMSLAHEYAHFLVSRDRPEVTVVLGEYKRVPASERFAESFSRHLLLPSEGVRRRFEITKASSPDGITPATIILQADFWRVSTQAMCLRLEDLGLVRGGTWQKLQSRGFRPEEGRRLLGLPTSPADTELLPRRYRWLAVDQFLAGNLSEGQLARFLRVDRLAARAIVTQLDIDATLGRELEDEPG